MSSPSPREPAEPGVEPDADPQSVARTICLRLLTAAPRTRAQLAAALQRRGVAEEAATSVLDRLTAVGLIDDEAYAAAWVQSRHRGRGLARRALGEELRRRGVSPEASTRAVASLDAEEEVETARSLVRRRLAVTAGLPTPVRVRRLTGLLARKGYPASVAGRVVREALEADALVADGFADQWGGEPEG